MGSIPFLRLKCKRFLMRNLLFLLLIFVSFSVYAQNETASGKVTNPRGEPVSFATIKVKGTKTTVVADADGSFRIRATTGQVLVITATSYTSKEFQLGQLIGNEVVLQPGQA